MGGVGVSLPAHTPRVSNAGLVLRRHGNPSSGFITRLKHIWGSTWQKVSVIRRAPATQFIYEIYHFSLNLFLWSKTPVLSEFKPLAMSILSRTARISTRPLPALIRLSSTSARPRFPAVIRPNANEIGASALSSHNLEIAVRHLHQDGLVVIEDAVPHEDIDNLNAKMVEDAYTLQARGEDGPFNYNQGNLQQDAPPVARYFSPSIFISKAL